MIVLAVVIAYGLLLVASTAHMSAAERADALLPWRCTGSSAWSLRVRLGDQRCDIDNVFIGDGMVRTGNRCVLEKDETNHERKSN
ncbi:hypothetical protein [Paraburkholderia sp. MM5477-R1]|uniref:hypothetical protein n=1 Tax=Paraburkholderia sp. MM5477-R1 TaxID=2991062 RepID=UPI003D219AB2